VFTTRAGKPVGPDRLMRLFRRLVPGSGLPPVTLHGLRHGAATLALAARTGLAAAEAVARLILRAGKRPPGGTMPRQDPTPSRHGPACPARLEAQQGLTRGLTC
jgi:hypothetical protein